MGPLPDLRQLFYLAIFGAICAMLAALVGGWWVGSHLIAALTMYLGGAS